MDRRWMFGLGRPFPWLLGLFLLVRWIMAEQCFDGCIKCEGSKCITCSSFLDTVRNQCISKCEDEHMELTNEGKQCRTVNTADSSSNNQNAVLIGVCSGGAVLFLVIVTGIMYFRRSRDKELQSSLIEAAQRRKSTQDYSHMNGGFEPDSFGPSEYRSRIFDLKPEIPTFVAMLNEVKKKAEENPVYHGTSCPYRTTFTELTRFVLLLKSNILNVSVMADSKQTLEWAENALQRYKETHKGNKVENHDERSAESVPAIVITEPEKLSIEIDPLDEDQIEVLSITEEWTDKNPTNQDHVSSAFDDFQLLSIKPQIPDIDYETVSIADSQTNEKEIQRDVEKNSPESGSEKDYPVQFIPDPDYDILAGVNLASSKEQTTGDEIPGHTEDILESKELRTLEAVNETIEFQIGNMTSESNEASTSEVKPLGSSNTQTKKLTGIILPSTVQLQVNETSKPKDKESIIPEPPALEKSLADVIAKMAAEASKPGETSDSRASTPNLNDSRASTPNLNDSRASTPSMSDSREGTPKTKNKLIGVNRQMGFRVSASTLMNAREGLRSVKDNNDREILNKSPDNKENRRQRKPVTTEPPSISKVDSEPDLVNKKTAISASETNQENTPTSEMKNANALSPISETEAVSEDEDDFTSL